MIHYQLSDLLMFEVKNLPTLRKENKLNIIFHNRLRGYWNDWNSQNQESRSAEIINEAYRLCAKFLLDKDPLCDVEYQYIRECDKLFYCENINDGVSYFSIYYAWILLTALKKHCEEHNCSCKPELQEFCDSLYFERVLPKMDDYWEKVQKELLSEAQKVDMVQVLRVRPWPLESLLRRTTYINKSTVAASTENDTHGSFDQDKIREIVLRYPNKEDRLMMLRIIYNCYYDYDIDYHIGILINDEPPFLL